MQTANGEKESFQRRVRELEVQIDERIASSSARDEHVHSVWNNNNAAPIPAKTPWSEEISAWLSTDAHDIIPSKEYNTKATCYYCGSDGTACIISAKLTFYADVDAFGIQVLVSSTGSLVVAQFH